MDARLRRTERITRQRDIDEVYKKGRRWYGKSLRVHIRPNGLPQSRLAISVPGRVCISVLRNRWKRLLRESFRLNKEAIGGGLDIVAVPTRPPEDLKRQDVEAILLALVRRHRGL